MIKINKLVFLLAASVATLAAFSTHAQDVTNPSAQGPTQLSEIKVIGGAEELVAPLAPQKVTKEKMAKQQFTDVSRALKQTSGVYVREEEGQGLRPNIGLRGTNPDRSKKVVLLEDGILIGPAPYSAPAAYYTPGMNHVEGLEVYKGFQAVPYGPNSIGGAVNYLSKSTDAVPRRELSLTAGSFDFLNLKADFANESRLFNLSRWQSSGFKKLDGGGDTGFSKNDIHLVATKKLDSSSGRLNQLKFRFGWADESSNETYLGLTEADFASDPYRRYKASAYDRMDWNHTKFQVEHQWQMSEGAVLQTSLYRHDFHRNWYRLDRFQDNSIKIADVLKNPTSGSNSVFYKILKGDENSSAAGGSNGNLTYARNDRRYYSQGLQTKLSGFSSADWNLDYELTARLHQDAITRNHTFDTYEMFDNRSLALVSSNNVDARNRDQAFARTVGGQVNATQGSVVLTGVFRGEVVSFENLNKISGASVKRDDRVLVSGVGALYKWSESLTTRASVNQAATLAGLDSAGKEAKEESLNIEVGARVYSADAQINGDLTFFRNDYRNITGTCTASTGCASNQLDTQVNGGKALIQGAELSLAKGYQLGKVWMPIFVNVTLLEAVFKNSFTSSSGEWGIGSVEEGDPLPYVPMVQYTLGWGTSVGPYEQEMTLIYQGPMYDQSVRSGRQQTDAYGIIDWVGKYKVNSDLGLVAKVDNLLGREYVTSLKPFGYRPGKPQSFHVGFQWAF